MSPWWALLPAILSVAYFVGVELLFADERHSIRTLWRCFDLQAMSIEALAYVFWLVLAGLASLLTWLVYGVVLLIVYSVS